MSASFVTLQAKKRQSGGKGGNRRLRAVGIIPAILYTHDGKNIPVQVDEAPLMKIVATLGRTTVFNLEVNDAAETDVYPALLWDMDFFPTKNRLLHADFFSVNLEKELKVRVPLEFIGTPIGAKVGGVVATFIEHLDILCKPLSLPNKITVDIAALELNQSLRVEDLALPEGVHAAIKGNATVVSIVTPEAEEENAATAADAAPAQA